MFRPACVLLTGLLLGCQPPEKTFDDYDELDGGAYASADAAGVTTDAAHPRDANVARDAGGGHADAAPRRDAAIAVADAAVSTPDAALPPSDTDTDGDGLPDYFEINAGAPELLNATLADTDGNGTDDGDEDPDNDGLTNLMEYQASRVPHSGAGGPSPLRLDVLIELDCMVDRCLTDNELSQVAAAYAALPNVGAAGRTGVGLQVYRDEMSIAAVDFDGSFEQRHAIMAGHGLTTAALTSSDFPGEQLVHVMVAARRTDIATRGGEAITDGAGDPNNTGAFIYYTALAALNPQCGVIGDNDQPDITLSEALIGTFAHEVGHTLQLGHDTFVGGEVNDYNVMSVPQSCSQAQHRFHGYQNSNASLGATQALKASRFSTAAANLIDFHNKVSVDTATLDNDTGHEM